MRVLHVFCSYYVQHAPGPQVATTHYAVLVEFVRHHGVDHQFEDTEETWWNDASSRSYVQMPTCPVIQGKRYSAVVQLKGLVQTLLS
jgi:hypothetical protein